MVFSDLAFVYFFLPLALLGILPIIKTRAGPLIILLFSIGFFYWSSGAYTLILLLSLAINYGAARVMTRWRSPSILYGTIILNLAVLFHYKYLGFLIDALNIQDTTSLSAYAKNLILPIGISFYTFQGISYLVDVWRKDIDAERDFILFGAYLSFFSQLIAGPIIRYKDVAQDFKEPQVSTDNILSGFMRFSIGLFKKVVIADTMGGIADEVFAQSPETLGLTTAWVGALAYTAQIYFDFSGYSDMAIGIARIFGIRIPENFNHPYASATITNFWRRWHISLSSWFRDYLYIPLGGNRKGEMRTYLNLGLVFLATGIWHGAAWTFVIWGIWHGVFITLEKVVLGRRAAQLDNTAMRFLYCLPVVIFGWVLFRSPDLGFALSYWQQMLTLPSWGMFDIQHSALSGMNNFQLSVFVISVVAMALHGHYKPSGTQVLLSSDDLAGRSPAQNWLHACKIALMFGVTFGMLLISTAFITSLDFSPFLYFRF